MAYISRHMEKEIMKASSLYPVVMVTGQRQVGKSTMLYHLSDKTRRYVTMDDVNVRRLAETDPELFFDTYGSPLLIDEFQRAPSLLLEIKRRVDMKALKGENNAGMYWLTGSQKFVMMKEIADSLAGRVAVFELAGFSTEELDGMPAEPFSPEIEVLRQRHQRRKQRDVHQVFSRIYEGSMPKPNALPELDVKRYYMDYINTYIERDIKALSQVGKLNEFYDFMVFMAARTGQELKYADIAKSIGVSAPTAKEWVTILERSGIIFILHPYFSNISKRLVKTPKMYFMDTGLAAYLCRWPDAATLEYGAMDGAFFETYVVTEIIKHYYNEGIRPPIYYYRDMDKKEIDLLIVDGHKLYPIEIKKGKSPANPDRNFDVLEKFKGEFDVQPALVVCMADELVPYKRDVWYCPVNLI